jgi:hypothetical protein
VFLQPVPAILRDFSSAIDAELDFALNHVEASRLVRSEGAASTDQSAPLAESLLITQRQHDVAGPLKVAPEL